jgi:glycosyltransferase involved in cell wall biosynthesis
LKILHVSKYYEPFKGGIEKVILELATGSVKAGHEVVVLSSNISLHYQEEYIEGVKVIRLPRWSVAFSQPINFSMMWAMKKWLEWADVVQVHTPNPLSEMSYLMQQNQTPLIATYHCDVVKQKTLFKAYQPVAHRLLKRADVITVSTPNHIKFSESLKDFTHKIKTIPFGIRAKNSVKSLEINNKMTEIFKRHSDFFLFVGRLVPYKGLDILLHSLSESQSNLVVIGQGPRWQAWNNLSQKLGLENRVSFLGAVEDDEDFAAYLQACKGLILPSINESEAFGLVLIEAMSCAKPVITTKLNSGVTWVNEKDVTGLEVMPKDIVGLRDAINRLQMEDVLRLQMGQNSLKRFNDLFTVDKMVTSYLDLYQESISINRSIAA